MPDIPPSSTPAPPASDHHRRLDDHSPLQSLPPSLSLRLGKVPSIWKTSCIIPVPKKRNPSAPNDFRPVALTSQVMKSLERLVLHCLKPQVHHAQDPLQFAYREKIRVEDAVLYLLHRTLSYLEEGRCAVRILFFDFSSAFNTIQPPLLWDKLENMSGATSCDLDYGLPYRQTTVCQDRQ